MNFKSLVGPLMFCHTRIVFRFHNHTWTPKSYVTDMIWTNWIVLRKCFKCQTNFSISNANFFLTGFFLNSTNARFRNSSKSFFNRFRLTNLDMFRVFLLAVNERSRPGLNHCEAMRKRKLEWVVRFSAFSGRKHEPNSIIPSNRLSQRRQFGRYRFQTCRYLRVTRTMHVAYKRDVSFRP